jgi:hypothetical protein
MAVKLTLPPKDITNIKGVWEQSAEGDTWT